MALDVGSPAPDFTGDSTQGPIAFHAWKGRCWGVLLFCPFAFTPVCTTELVAFAFAAPVLEEDGIRVAVNCIDTLGEVTRWADNATAIGGRPLPFPIIADVDRAICRAYGTVPDDIAEPVRPGRWLRPGPDWANRGLFVVTPDHRVAFGAAYPPNVGYHVGHVRDLIARLKAC